MSKTINGRELSQVMQELSVPCNYQGGKKKDFGGRDYITIQAFRKRMNEVIGIEHYTEEYTPIQMHTLMERDGQTNVFVTVCTITIFDDEGNPIISKSCAGGDQPSPVDKTGKYLQLNNSLESACAHAFKCCCKRFDVFGLGTSKESSNSNGQEQSQRQSQPPTDAVCLTFTSSKAISLMEGRTPDKPSFITEGKVQGSVTNDVPVEIIFWNRQFKAAQEKLESLISLSENRAATGKPYSFKCYCTKKDFKGKTQYHFQYF